MPSSPKGEIVGIMTLVWLYGTGVVLDGNSLKWKNYVQDLKMMKNKRFAGASFKRCGPADSPFRKYGHPRRFSVHKVRSPSSLSLM